MAKVDSTSCFYVYVHRRATDGRVFYVGKGKGRRAWTAQGRSNYWRNIVAKHGLIVEVVQDNMQEWWAFEMECELIALYGRENLCNLTDGGDGTSGAVRSVESKRKTSISHMHPLVRQSKSDALKKHYQKEGVKAERAQKIKQAYVDNPNLRIKASQIIKARLSDPVTRKKMSESRIGCVFSESTKQKMREKALNMSAEHKRKLSQGQMGALNPVAVSVVCIETGQIFECIKDATNWLKSLGWISAQTTPITRNIQGRKYKKAYGYTWKYA